MLRVALSHDVDRIRKSYQYLTRIGRTILTANLEGFINQFRDIGRKNPFWGFDEIIRIESEFGVKSTFFFLNESIRTNLLRPDLWKLSLGRYRVEEEKVSDIIRWLDSNGWEIGVHGSYLSYRMPALLLSEKLKLEAIVDHEIVGVRQHYINLDDTTWKIQSDIGFKYDSTWGLREDIGFRENRIRPFNPFSDSFYVIPFAIMDSCFSSTENKWHKLQELIDTTILNDSILVLNWHSNNYSETDFPGYKSDYIRIIQTCLRQGARFYTLKEYYDELTHDL